MISVLKKAISPIGIFGALLLFAVMLSTSLQAPQVAQAANGDNLRTITADRTGTACVTTGSGFGGVYPGAHSSVGVGIAFDGTNLLISCYGDSTVTEVSPADGSQVAVHLIAGASSLGALAYDGPNSLLYGCSSFGDVGTVDLTANTYTFLFSTGAVGGSGCFDGLAYDGSDGTIWASGDVSGTVEHYTLAGALITSTPVALGACGNSGIAVGGAKLYLANNGCSEIYEVAKDFSTSVLFATLTARVEDLECDNITFAPASGAIWSTDAYDNILNAWEIPADQCAFGGGEPKEDTRRMTGGGTIAGKTIEVRHGFELHCDATKVPNNLEVNWGKGNKFHMEVLNSAVCSDAPIIDEGQPDAGFDTYVGKGTGRYNGVAGATVKFEFTDEGEPGVNDTARITIVDVNANVVLVASGKITKGNQQAHP